MQWEAAAPPSLSSTLAGWLRPAAPEPENQAAQQKRRRGGGEAHMHGVSVSDHGEKATWSGYWDERQRKLLAQPVDGDLYAAVTTHLDSGAARGGPGEAATRPEAPSDIFRQCRLYFTGRVDGGGGLSSFALGKLARHHGADVTPRCTKHGVTHVICTQLSGSKERAALLSGTSRGAVKLYFVRPEWITQSIVARRRLSEVRFSVVAEIAQSNRVSARPVISLMARSARRTSRAGSRTASTPRRHSAARLEAPREEAPRAEAPRAEVEPVILASSETLRDLAGEPAATPPAPPAGTPPKAAAAEASPSETAVASPSPSAPEAGGPPTGRHAAPRPRVASALRRRPKRGRSAGAVLEAALAACRRVVVVRSTQSEESDDPASTELDSDSDGAR